MRNTFQEDRTKLSSDTVEHLTHLATASFAKNKIPEDHLEILLKHDYIKQVLGGHIPTDKGHAKLLEENQ